MNNTSNFIFVVCQAGAEVAVKTEIANSNPGLKFSYSRPGFITFKSPTELAPDFSLHSKFCYAYGITHQKFKKDQISELFSHLNTKTLHVIERELYEPEKSPKEYSFGKLREQFISENEKKLKSFSVNQSPENGDLVGDIILIDENEIWLGSHIHSNHHRPFPGGRPDIKLPEKAPSRAYLKLEEAILLNDIKFGTNDVAIEVGSAPGGASFALLERGLTVVGIDSAEMDKIILKNKNFQHIQKSIVDVQPNELPKIVHWILIDINQKPEIALKALEWLIPKFKKSLKGLILTFKFSDWKSTENVQKIEKNIKSYGFKKIISKHLINNKKEINITALV